MVRSVQCNGFNFSTYVKTQPFSLGKDFGTFLSTLLSDYKMEQTRQASKYMYMRHRYYIIIYDYESLQ